MRKSADPSELGFNARDRLRLARALNQTSEARLFRRLQAVLLVAEGRRVADVAHITGLGQSSVYYLRDQYLRTHAVTSLRESPRAGRPVVASDEVRRRYGRRVVYMLLDEAPCHIAGKSEALAAQLDIHSVWLPKQCSELNAMDQLWKELKSNLSANYQYASIDEHAETAQAWVLDLTDKEALRKAGVLSKNFWLRSFL